MSKQETDHRGRAPRSTLVALMATFATVTISTLPAAAVPKPSGNDPTPETAVVTPLKSGTFVKTRKGPASPRAGVSNGKSRRQLAPKKTKPRARAAQSGSRRKIEKVNPFSVAALFENEKAEAALPAVRRSPRPLPAEFLNARVEKVFTELLARPPRVTGSNEAPLEIAADAKKQPFLAAIYARNLVEASPRIEFLADKLIMARVIERALGDDARQWLPKTMGLKEFLQKHALVDGAGRITADGDEIERALYEEFPAGFNVRPAVGIAPRETSKGLVRESDEFVIALLSGRSPYYEPRHFRRPVKSSVLGEIASGEAVILQDDVVMRADVKKKLISPTFREIRVHTYEGKVVADAVPVRWVSGQRVSVDDAKKAEDFVARLLSRLPPGLVERQAWGVDVAVFDNGEMVVTEIVTNRGRRIQWSSYLEQPRVIGAYARHFETYAGVRFDGVSGALMRNNLGNYMPYWQTRIEKARPGWSKIVSYLPPVP